VPLKTAIFSALSLVQDEVLVLTTSSEHTAIHLCFVMIHLRLEESCLPVLAHDYTTMNSLLTIARSKEKQRRAVIRPART
jgi:hypothetical protein